ncbi:hypothetical protein T4D_8230 [Trichinella pseudospiralis]|uniref:Uncharacterized protein n=1 Tax=Trichinella pseudospiralis TaxID=6337 RepID=A0A0V1FCH5_TRIPS|nr:hypothetical protein T4D_8230 [Trichinella pseudospiralis]
MAIFPATRFADLLINRCACCCKDFRDKPAREEANYWNDRRRTEKHASSFWFIHLCTKIQSSLVTSGIPCSNALTAN